MIERDLQTQLLALFSQYPLVAVLGPRQAGKTMLARKAFPALAYVSLEDLDMRHYAAQDPRGFLQQYQSGAIIDEAQLVPSLFSYLQTHVDLADKPGQFVLTGSHNFLLMESISQSLAGRVAILQLLPLSFSELKAGGHLPQQYEQLIVTGSYPRIYRDQLEPYAWYQNYIRTYVERDLRQVKNVLDLSSFQLFMKLCAGRVGQTINLSALASECGITHKTAKEWLGVLQVSGLIVLLQPYYRNFNKRLVKMPKLYFVDTGIACALLGITDHQHLHSHFARGALFENLIILELIKTRLNQNQPLDFHYWRDQAGHEVDCVFEIEQMLRALEIKSGRTINSDYFKQLHYWLNLAEGQAAQGFLVYGGDRGYQQQGVTILPWQDCAQIFSQ